MTFPAGAGAVAAAGAVAVALAAVAPVVEPESAIAQAPSASAIDAAPAASDVVSLRPLKILRLSVILVRPLIAGRW